MVAQAVEAELNGFLAAHADQTDSSGRRRLVRHGHLPEREVQTGIGAVPVKVPRVRDRGDYPQVLTVPIVPVGDSDTAASGLPPDTDKTGC